MIKFQIIINNQVATLELSFLSDAIRDICLNRDTALKIFGDTKAEKLIDRLADIRAATSPIELISGKPRLIDINSNQY